MTLPAPENQGLHTQGERKRKRAKDEREDDADAQDTAPGLFEPENGENDVTDNENDNQNDLPYMPESDEDDEYEVDENGDDHENYHEEGAGTVTYDESQELFPACTIYNDGIPEIKTRLTRIPEELLTNLSADDIKSKSLNMHIATAKSICIYSDTDRVKIAILGRAGAGKSSLVNTVTNIPDLAKSVLMIPPLIRLYD